MLISLCEKFGAEDFFRHLNEVFDYDGYIHDLSDGDEITAIDLDTPYYTYESLFSGELLRRLNDF